ncbi:adenylosuccinate lyase family protein [Saccharopolyspora sp. K220]|uniref:class-II fumarase/aspartase family protein n=1 Tax=Saccharopolyspora soli TaxID=2926618 RepID=UPI001F583CA7|nr:adenylosuccinate lyase family protein [Saccharopolyspora soli]MCI2421755.1 adenylosuccinate lyase family protein [Saccharopolyspora soli]
MGSADRRTPFGLLSHLYGDPAMAAIFSAESAVQSWLRTEAALARAQAEVGVLTAADAQAIAAAARLDNIDLDLLWSQARNVGYPILGLVRQISAALDGHASGRVHFGATTQDIMDTGLALQLVQALDLLTERVTEFGDALARQVARHRDTVLAARTHAQQAVPTTLGATLATLLEELRRHRSRLAEARPRIGLISSHGAGGTSAAQGPTASQVRDLLAAELGLTTTAVPWHTARDGVAEFGWLCSTLAGTCARLARNVADLSRTEIGEVHEPAGHHRGASSTMPQKANPIFSEAIIGMAGTAGALSSALVRAQEAGHERSAGEWQIEWEVVPQLAVLAGGALRLAGEIARDLVVDTEAMRRNLAQDGGLLMAEAWMINLAESLGRETAHDLVYTAAREVREGGGALGETVQRLAAERGITVRVEGLEPDSYLGEAGLICDTAVARWEKDEL